MSTETDDAVDAYLLSNFVEYKAVFVQTTKLDPKWECDEWRIILTGPNKTSMAIEFFTGMALRKKAKMPTWEKNRVGPRGIERWHRENDKPQAPRAATVLHSTLMDARALDTSFEYWCDDFGYSSDSIKHLNVYQACCEIGKKINAMFNHEQRKHLNELLEDY